MAIQQFRVTLGAATIDVCGDYTPAEALQAARDALEGCFAAGCSVRVLLCVAAADGSGQWVRFDNVTAAAQAGPTRTLALITDRAIRARHEAGYSFAHARRCIATLRTERAAGRAL